jgi:hypothetical protein
MNMRPLLMLAEGRKPRAPKLRPKEISLHFAKRAGEGLTEDQEDFRLWCTLEPPPFRQDCHQRRSRPRKRAIRRNRLRDEYLNEVQSLANGAQE